VTCGAVGDNVADARCLGPGTHPSADEAGIVAVRDLRSFAYTVSARPMVSFRRYLVATADRTVPPGAVRAFGSSKLVPHPTPGPARRQAGEETRLPPARPSAVDPVAGARRGARVAWRAPAGRAVASVAAAASLALSCLALWSVHDARAARASPLDATTILVSADVDGGKGNGLDAAYPPALAGEARHVAFASTSANLVPGDANGRSDVFVRDLDPATGIWRTSRISAAFSGGEADGDSFDPSVSADGRYVAFASDATNLVANDRNGTTDVFLWDRRGQAEDRIVRVSANGLGGDGNGYSWEPSVSADGKVVSFLSEASNLVPGDGNGYIDVFVWDRSASLGPLTLVSGGMSGQGDGGAWQQVLSADGSAVAFVSDATNLVPGDDNLSSDVFVHDGSTGRTTLESRASDGTVGDSWSFFPAISADGGVVAFDSVASNFARNEGERPDVFVRDRSTGRTTLVSVGPAAAKADHASFAPSLSADGRWVAFDSYATNLVPQDANGYGSDVFVRDLVSETTTLASVDVTGMTQFDQAYNAAVSPDGDHVAFVGLSVSLDVVDAQYYLRGPLRSPLVLDASPPTSPATRPAVDTTTATTGSAPTATTADTTTSTEPATTSAPTTATG